MLYIKVGIIAGIVWMVLDALWLGVIARPIYKQEIGALMRANPNWIAAGIVYVLMIAGFLWFVFPQVQMTRSLLQAMQIGARFGVVLFGVYNFTNYAVLSQWSLIISFMDTIWGGVTYAIVSAVIFVMRGLL